MACDCLGLLWSLIAAFILYLDLGYGQYQSLIAVVVNKDCAVDELLSLFS